MPKQGCKASFNLGANKVAAITTVTNSYTGDTLDITTFDSACVREFLAGLRSGTMDVSGYYDPTDTTGQVAMFTALFAGTTLTGVQKPKFLVDELGNGFESDGIVTAYNVDAAVEDKVNFSATLQLTGAPTVLTA